MKKLLRFLIVFAALALILSLGAPDTTSAIEFNPSGNGIPNRFSPAPLPLLTPSAPTGTLPNPILFVTQIPVPADFTTIGSTFGNHLGDMQSVARGGDLWIRYPDGTQKNLTETAGYGNTGFQGASSIAVRQPSVHWDGEKALFSMVIGAPTEQWVWEDYFWQIYEITGLGQGETPVITKIPNQPANYNNISPIYTTDDDILFVSDRPWGGLAHLYPLLDEYEEAPSNTGIWRLDPITGDLRHLDHAPSGDFTPMIDSFGRVIFTRWDHLQRDQQADADNYDEMNGNECTYCTFNYSDESAGAQRLDTREEVFPEPRADHDLEGTNLWGHTFNHFFPWMMNEDGTALETLNHIGRHELHDYMPPSLVDDPNLQEMYDFGDHFNPDRIENMFHVRETQSSLGNYVGIDAPEFYTHAAGMVFALNAHPETDADHISVTYITHPETADYTDNPGPNHSGLYRNPLPLIDGTMLVVHTSETREDDNTGTRTNPGSRYDFRIKPLVLAGNGYFEGGQPITSGISKSVNYWDPDYRVYYDGEMWELDPVELVARPRPVSDPTTLPGPEMNVFDEEGVNLNEFISFLETNNLALIVSRDVTKRDDFDTLQPFNLRILGGTAETIGAPGRIYDMSYIQFFQGDHLRGLDYGGGSPNDGRRILAQPLHDTLVYNPPNTGGPPGAMQLGSDGSMAAIVPAGRALSWQTTDNEGVGVVRERYWLTFQPGEIRVCTSCHGLNEFDQAGNPEPTNEPEALRELLQYWLTWQTLEPEAYLPSISD